MGRPRKKPVEETLEETSAEEMFEEPLEEERGDIEIAASDFSPLFPNAGKPESKTPAHIIVHQIHPVRGAEYRGKLQPDATEETIFAQWGNGTYNLRMVDEHSRYLRSRSNVKINMNAEDPSDSKSVSPRADFDISAIRELIREERERSISITKADRERDEKRATEDRHRADSFLAMIQASRVTEAEQTRQFFTAQQAMATQSFNQTLQIITASTTMQMQMMQAQLKAATERPNSELQTFLAGLQFANGINPLEDDRPDPMTAVLAGGLQMFGQIAGAAGQSKKKSLPPPPKKALASGSPEPAALPSPIDAPPVLPPALSEEPPKKKGALSEDEIEEIKALKILSAQKGISMAAILKLGRENIDQLAAFVGTPPEEEEELDEEEPDEEGDENEELDESQDSEHSSDGDDESDEDDGNEPGSDSVDGEEPSDEEGTD